MRTVAALFAALAALCAQQDKPFEAPVQNLPAQKIGANDLLLITVSDSPELTRTFRVDPTGSLDLPLLNRSIRAAGFMPAELERAIAKLLKDIFFQME